jgi:molybdate transport system substrate-binding protein
MMRFFGLLVMAALCLPSGASADEIKVLAANAVRQGFAEIASRFEASSGHTVAATFAGSVAAANRIKGGEIFDIVIVGSDTIDQLVKAGRLAEGSRVDFATSGVGAATRVGLDRPDIGSAEGVKAAVLASKTVAYSAGPSGAAIGELLKRLGVASHIEGRVKQPSSGAEVAILLQTGEADLGFGQVSEFLNVPGLVDLGPLPPEVQAFTVYAAGVHVQAARPEAARALIVALTALDAVPAIRKMGMERS